MPRHPYAEDNESLERLDMTLMGEIQRFEGPDWVRGIYRPQQRRVGAE